MLLIPNALCWSSQKCNCTCALPAEVQLHLRVTRRSWQKLFAGKNFVKILVTVQTQLRSYSEQQRALGNSNICNSRDVSWPEGKSLKSAGTWTKSLQNGLKMNKGAGIRTSWKLEVRQLPENLHPCTCCNSLGTYLQSTNVYNLNRLYFLS